MGVVDGLVGCDKHHPNMSRSGGWMFAVAATFGLYMWYATTVSSNKDESSRNGDEKDVVSSTSASVSTSSASASASSCIYLDYNGTTPIYPEVLNAMMPYLKGHFGNPSSSHYYGQHPRKAIDKARYQILNLLGVSTSPPDNDENETNLKSIWFTACGTESDNLAIQLAIQSTIDMIKKKQPKFQKPHIVTCNVEHPAIELYLKYLQEEGGMIDVTYVAVQPGTGRVLAKDIIDAIQENTILVTLMLANNESGTLQPIQEVATECRRRGILIHTDAAQAAGKVSIDIKDLGYPDLISVVGHKLGAPKGIAALYVRPGCLQEHDRRMKHNHGILLIGGGQEFGRRGGTENTPYIVGFGMAAELAKKNLARNARHMEQMRNRLLLKLQHPSSEQQFLTSKVTFDETIVRPNGPSDPNLRLPNTLSIGFQNIHSGDLLRDIGHQVAASAGATCHSTGSVSSVLRAMQIPDEFARGTLRLSLGPKTTSDDVDNAARIIIDAVRNQWETNQSWPIKQTGATSSSQ